MDPSKVYAIHLDTLRIQSKISVNDLCAGIVDPRTYRRYMSGERSLTHNKIDEFCTKLKISTTDFYYTARKTDIYEFQKLRKLYAYIENYEYDKFNKAIKEVKREQIIDVQNRRFYDFCVLKVAFELHKKPHDEIMTKLSEIADYPNSVNKTAFDFVDLIALQLIAAIETKYEKETALKKLIDILNNPTFIYTSSEANIVIPSIYTNVAVYLLKMNRFEHCKSVSIEGIAYSLKHYDISGLAHLYYCLSYSSLRLGDKLAAEENGALCLMAAMIKKSKHEIDMFTKALTNDFKVDPYSFLTRHRNTLTKNDD